MQSAKFLVQAAAHGVAQGAMAMMQSGGSGFLSGAAAGFFGSLGATAWSAGAGKFAHSDVGTIAFGALSGGVGAELTGGNFWQGAITGGIVAWLNDVMHSKMEKRARKTFLKRFHKINPFAKPDMNEQSINSLLEDVDGLDALHKKSDYKIEVSHRENSGMRGYTDNKTHYFYEDAFTSNFKLASTMFHEFYHAFQEVFMGGLAYRLAAKEGGFGYINGNPDLPLGGERYIERHAYQFEWDLGNHSSYVSEGINKYKKL